MGYPAGKPNPNGGRPKGVLNKRTWEARKLAAELEVDPLEIALRFAKGDWQGLGYPSATKTVLDAEGNAIQVDRIDESLRSQNAIKAIPFLYPTLKSVELTGEAGEALSNSLALLLAGKAAPNKEASGTIDVECEPVTGSGDRVPASAE